MEPGLVTPAKLDGCSLATTVPVDPMRELILFFHSHRVTPLASSPHAVPPHRSNAAMAPSGLCREGALRGRDRPFPSLPPFPPPPWRPCPATAASSAASSAGPRPGPPRPAGLHGGSSAARASRSRAPGGPQRRVRAAGSGDAAVRRGRERPVQRRPGSRSPAPHSRFCP